MQSTELERPGKVVMDAHGVVWYRGRASWVSANGTDRGDLEPVPPVTRLVPESSIVATA